VPNEPDNEDLVLFSDFMRFLAAPPGQPSTFESRRGQYIFANIGCANCHVPELRTGPHPVRALDRVTFRPYSDFLLHDMGSLGDGMEQGRAGAREMRTAPLWGVGSIETLLHDGRATTLDQAIRAHDGQGRAARNRYVNLSTRDKGAVVAFLRTL
jgi:CxxC motif-containing protein (DUF1111 family)